MNNYKFRKQWIPSRLRQKKHVMTKLAEDLATHGKQPLISPNRWEFKFSEQSKQHMLTRHHNVPIHSREIVDASVGGQDYFVPTHSIKVVKERNGRWVHEYEPKHTNAFYTRNNISRRAKDARKRKS